MKKILIINHYAGCPKYGAHFRHYHFAKELVKKGHQVKIIASSYTHLKDKNPNIEEEYIDDILFRWIKTPRYSSAISRIYNMLIFSLKLFFQNKTDFTPDIILISSPSLFPILNAVRLKKKYKAKLIYEIRDVWPQSIIELKGSSPKNPLIRFFDWLDTYGIRNADIIASPLQHISKYIKSKNFEKPILVLPNGISTEDIELVDNKPNTSNQFIVGYGGTLGDSNSIMNLVKAAVQLKDNSTIFFKIIGGGEKFEEIKHIIEIEQLKNIELTGKVDKKTLFKKLGECDVLYKGNPRLNIYSYGISSIKIVEYFLLKKPVIDASFGVKIVQDAKAGYVVEHENTQELVDGILEMKAMSPQKLKEMGENGYSFVINNLTYDKIADKFIHFISKK